MVGFWFVVLCIACCDAAQTTVGYTTKTATTGSATTYETSHGTTTDSTQGNCCNDLQVEIDSLKEEMASLKQTVDELQDQVDRIENTVNFTETKRSCDEYKHLGFTSDSYTIDPDGAEGSIEAFDVYCDMDADPQWAVTMLDHDSEERTLVSGCQSPGCYSHSVTYAQTSEQIEAVMSQARSCQQYLSYECLGSMLFEYNDYAWWVSRGGVSQYYWPGADPGSKMCACGKNGTCEGTSTTCNCDNNDRVWRQDDGYLTSKDTLPVSQLYFGDVLGLEERGYFTLGKLECIGTVDTRDCASLKAEGYSSGYYEISPESTAAPFSVYCDMDSYPGTGISVIHHDKEGKTGPLYYYTTNDITVTYTNVTMDQITSLINASQRCEQYIEWQCYRTGMLYYGYTWWISRQGDAMTYWGGANPNHDSYCACGETGSCEPGTTYSYKCNCDDTSSSSTRVDGGYLYDKNTLPVTGMHFGFYYSSSSYYGYYTLGPLQCY